MKHGIELKQAKSIKVGEHILKAHSSGILLGEKVLSVNVLDDCKWVEVGIGELLFLVGGEDTVAVVE
jgi:hypothetical protein